MASGMSSATIARWSMPLVCMLGLHTAKKRLYGCDESGGIFTGNVMSGVDFYDFKARIGSAHLRGRLGRIHIGARASQREYRTAHFAHQLPHVDAELRTL